MTDWKRVEEAFRVSLHRHAVGCVYCRASDEGWNVMVSSMCQHGAVILSEVIIAKVQAETEATRGDHD